MEEENTFSQEQKTESLSKALIGAGYDMSTFQAEKHGRRFWSSDDEVFDLLNKGATKYINENYGKEWNENYPEPKYK